MQSGGVSQSLIIPVLLGRSTIQGGFKEPQPYRAIGATGAPGGPGAAAGGGGGQQQGGEQEPAQGQQRQPGHGAAVEAGAEPGCPSLQPLHLPRRHGGVGPRRPRNGPRQHHQRRAAQGAAQRQRQPRARWHRPPRTRTGSRTRGRRLVRAPQLRRPRGRHGTAAGLRGQRSPNRAAPRPGIPLSRTGLPSELGPRPDCPSSAEPTPQTGLLPGTGLLPFPEPGTCLSKPGRPTWLSPFPPRDPPSRIRLKPPAGTCVPVTPLNYPSPDSLLPPGSALRSPAPAPGCGPVPCTGLRSRFSARSARPADVRTELPRFPSRSPASGCLPPLPPRLPGQVPVPPRGGRWVPRAAVAHGRRTHTHTQTRTGGTHMHSHAHTREHLLCTYPVQEGPLCAPPSTAPGPSVGTPGGCVGRGFGEDRAAR
ncbi:WAS/WASL-interacting protein family member 1-like [Corvus cornix cornix]|uniref:WAS/WASL-interacting protein family member 1-like n=1 Tax=Corvus cornix cornix TaxID=932674 RepID=UPI00194F2D02|nr:WAS/WASL-interacting protein family member 1-like [Corvus cornix cornix]